MSLINSEISDCRASNAGGALYVMNMNYKVRMEGSTFTSCSADKVRHVENQTSSAKVTSAPPPLPPLNAGRRCVRGKGRGEPDQL